MPLEIRVDVIPGGVEQSRKTLGTIRITQVEKLDDDLRVYEVRGGWDGNRVTRVQHARREGPMELARKAISADLGYQIG